MSLLDLICSAKILKTLHLYLDFNEKQAVSSTSSSIRRFRLYEWETGSIDCLICCNDEAASALSNLQSFSLTNCFLVNQCILTTSSVYPSGNFYLELGTIGWGLKSYNVIPRCAFILAYYGEYINTNELRKRQVEYDKIGCNFVLTVKEHTFETIDSEGVVIPSVIIRTNVDATLYGGVARFVNHSCDPNCEIVMQREPEALLGQPVLRTLRVIAPGEEITFDYGASDTIEEDQGSKKRKIDDDVSRTPCCCGSTRCRKYLPGNT